MICVSVKFRCALTVGGLVGAGVYALFVGLWAPVLLTIALTHVADFNPREKRLAFALTLAAFSAIFQPEAALICALILGFWILWEFGILGGADVKLLIAATLVLGNPIVLIPIAVSGGIEGVIASLQKKRRFRLLHRYSVEPCCLLSIHISKTEGGDWLCVS